MTCPNKNTPEFRELLRYFDETAATIAYFRNGEQLPSAERAAQLLQMPLPEERGEENAEKQPPFVSKVYLDNILSRLKLRFGLDYSYVHQPDANWKGRVSQSGAVEINTAKVTADTPFHEYLHPFIRLMQQQSPQYYDSLVSELQKDISGQQEIANTRQFYKSYNEKQILEEALVSYIGKLSAKNVDNDGHINKLNTRQTSLLHRLMQYLANVLNNLFGTRFQVVSPTADLQWLADHISLGDLNSNLQEGVKLLDKDYFYQLAVPSEFAGFLKDVRDKAEILSKIYSRRKSGEIVTDLRKIVQTLDKEDIDMIDKVKTFVNSSAIYIEQALKRYEQIKANANTELSREDILHDLHIMDELKNLMSLYQGIEDIDVYLNTLSPEELERYSEDDKSTTIAAVRNAKLIKASYRSTAINLLAQWVMPYARTANQTLEKQIADIDELIKKHPEKEKNYLKDRVGYEAGILTEEKLKQSFNQALRDISSTENWLGATISSSDNVSALVAMALADSVYKSQADAATIKLDLEEAYEQARKPNKLLTTGEEEWNKQYLRQAKILTIDGKDKDGKPVFSYKHRWAFHEAYLWDQFENEKKILFDQYADQDNKEHRRKIAEWFKENTKLSYGTAAEQESLLKQKKETLTSDQYRTWYYENTLEVELKQYDSGGTNLDYAKANATYVPGSVNEDSYRVWDGEMMQPSEKFKNPQFDQANKTPYYNKLYQTYKEANNRLGDKALKYGIIPQVSKGKFLFSDIEWNGGIEALGRSAKTKLKDKLVAYDNEQTIERPDGTDYKEVPVRFTRMLAETDLSLDLLSSVLQFSSMSLHHASMQEAEPFATMVKTVVLGNEALGIKERKVKDTNAAGKPLSNAIKTLINRNINKKSGIKVNERLSEFIDDVVYGTEEIKASINLAGYEISLNKLGSFMNSLMAVQSMAFNFISGINNNVLGNVISFAEAAGGKYYTRKQYRQSFTEYTKAIPEMLNAIAGGPVNKIMFLQMHYDALQGEARDHYGKKVSGGVMNKYFNRSALFFQQHMGDHQFQCTGMMAMMKNTPVKLKDGTETNLWDAWEKEGNKFRLKENAVWTEQEDQALRNRLHAINKLLHGNYNKFDKSRLQRTWYGKAVLQFRKHIYTSIKARYGKRQVNYEMGDMQEGYYNRFINTLIRDIKTYKWEMATKVFTKDYRNSLTTDEVYALKKTTYELGCFVTAIMIGSAIGAVVANDDDENKKRILKNVQLQSARLESDISMYIPPLGFDDFERIFKSPAAMISLLDKYRQVLLQLTNPAEQYLRSGPGYNMGEYKLWHKMERALPVLIQFEKVMNPEDQLRVFKQINQK